MCSSLSSALSLSVASDVVDETSALVVSSEPLVVVACAAAAAVEPEAASLVVVGALVGSSNIDLMSTCSLSACFLASLLAARASLSLLLFSALDIDYVAQFVFLVARCCVAT